MPDPATPTVEQTFTQTKNSPCGSKQPGMSSHPTHQPAMLIMHLALYDPFTPRTVLGCSNGAKMMARFIPNGQEEELFGEMQAFGDTATKQLIHWYPADSFDELSEQDETKITILATPSGWKYQRLVHYGLENGGSMLRCADWFHGFKIGLIGRQSRGMEQDIEHGYLFFPLMGTQTHHRQYGSVQMGFVVRNQVE